ncbi:methyltransferase domain-containing protein [Streptomyces sp. AV19]|nr:methyltransferase domain-containing protein [Streptomyces sp. AV19]
MYRGSVLLPERLSAAFLNVDRHPYVPAFFRRVAGGFVPWRATAGDMAAWLAAVYTDESLITEVDGVHAEDAAEDEWMPGTPTSSSTMPSLMADMLDALNVNPGDQVLEIGTGSGYNAALLCHLAGDHNVATVDVAPRLTERARNRLEEGGYRPVVVCADGRAGHDRGAPYDRLIATGSVPDVPSAWLEQCALGALLVIPLKGALAGGMIARLKKTGPGSASGYILHSPASFMPLRGERELVSRPPRVEGRERVTAVPGAVIDDWSFSFFAQLHLPPAVVRDYDDRECVRLYDPGDGSQARVIAEHGGGHHVVVTGPEDLWEPVERAYAEWTARDRPRREWFIVHITPKRQWLSLRTADGDELTWTLPGWAGTA